MNKLIPRKLVGGNLYKVDSTMPLITLRYVSLLNKGIRPLAAFDTAHLSMIEDGRPGKYYSFGKRARDLAGWTLNATDSLTVGRYKNLQNVLNFKLFKLGLRLKNYNSRPAFYNIEMNRNRTKDKQIINLWNKLNNLPLVASLSNYNESNLV